jgi:tetratricopeptide (TPR) repeat protein
MTLLQSERGSSAIRNRLALRQDICPMPRKVIEVFLSSTAQDLAPYRIAVRERLVRTGLFHCIRQEDFGAQDASAIEFCRKQAQACDMFVGLVGLRRGWEPNGDNERRSITEMEHDWAREGGRRRFLWVMPDDFKLAANMRDPDDLYGRQIAFRQRVMGSGERIVSQNGFDTPELLASEIVEHLLTQVVTSDLIAHVRSDLGYHESPSAEEQKPAIAAAVEKLTENKDIDLLALARNPKDVDLADLESKLKTRAEEHEAEGRRESKAAAEYWRHIGALTFLHNTQKALAAYEKAVALDPEAPDGWRYFGELQRRVGDLVKAERAFATLRALGQTRGDLRIESLGSLRLAWIAGDRGQLAAATELAEAAHRSAKSAGWIEGVARAANCLGIVHQDRGDPVKSEEMHLMALKLEEELGSKEGIARANGNLGVIYRIHGDLAKAEEMQLKALKLNEELGSKEGMAIAYGNLGLIHEDRDELAKAEEMLLKTLRLHEELGSKVGMAKACRDLGHIYDATKNKRRMCEYWRKERDLWRDMGLTEKVPKVEERLKLHGCKTT